MHFTLFPTRRPKQTGGIFKSKEHKGHFSNNTLGQKAIVYSTWSRDWCICSSLGLPCNQASLLKNQMEKYHYERIFPTVEVYAQKKLKQQTEQKKAIFLLSYL